MERVLHIVKDAICFVARKVLDLGIEFALGCFIAYLFGGIDAAIGYAKRRVGVPEIAC